MKSEDSLIPEEEFLRRNKVCLSDVIYQCFLFSLKVWGAVYDLRAGTFRNKGFKLSVRASYFWQIEIYRLRNTTTK